ncbi:MAG: vWA domain-containing protein [Prosthecobacter sp.]
MNWLFPLYLAGAAAIIAPILLHLRRRPPQDRVEFSSLLFLDAQTPVPVRKRRLENWLLLLLRCLALILLALMFARPFVQKESSAATSANHATLILLDRSASMRREDLWKRAVTEAQRLLRDAKLTDRVSLAVFDRELIPVWTFEEDRNTPANRQAAVQSRLAGLTPTWNATHLDRALMAAVPSFDSSTANLRKRIVLVGDLQEGAHLDALRTLAWPAELALQVKRIDPASNDNFSLALAASEVADAPQQSGPAAPNTPASLIRVRLGNTRDSTLRDFTLAWQDAPKAEAINAQMPAGASRILTAPPNAANATLLTVSGDKHDFDNRLFIAPPQPRTVRLHFLGDNAARDEAASPLYYLARALQPTDTLAPQLTADKDFPAQVPDVLFLSGTTPKAEMHGRLRDFLTQGGFLVHVAQSPADAALLQTLSGVQGITIAEGNTDDYRMLADVKTDHPLLRPFADPRLRDFTKLRFWKHRRIQAPAGATPAFETLATFDNQDAAILAARVGKGTLIVLASGWHPADSQLALSTKFVPLLFGWLSAAGFSHDPASSLLVGDPLPLDATQAHTITDPENKTHSRKPGETFTTTQAGLYKVQGGTHTKTVAANLPPDEGRVLPLDPQKLAEHGLKLTTGTEAAAAPDAAEQQRLTSADSEQRQQGWWWILVILLAVLLLETWFAGRARQTTLQAA